MDTRTTVRPEAFPEVVVVAMEAAVATEAALAVDTVAARRLAAAQDRLSAVAPRALSEVCVVGVDGACSWITLKDQWRIVSVTNTM